LFQNLFSVLAYFVFVIVVYEDDFSPPTLRVLYILKLAFMIYFMFIPVLKFILKNTC